MHCNCVSDNSSKIHLAVDTLDNPIEFIEGDGVTHNIRIAPALLEFLKLKGATIRQVSLVIMV